MFGHKLRLSENTSTIYFATLALTRIRYEPFAFASMPFSIGLWACWSLVFPLLRFSVKADFDFARFPGRYFLGL